MTAPVQGRNRSRRARVRALRAAKQRRYRALQANGRVVIEPRVDPDELAELLGHAGIMIMARDRATLALGVEALMRLWEEGALRVTLERESP